MAASPPFTRLSTLELNIQRLNLPDFVDAIHLPSLSEEARRGLDAPLPLKELNVLSITYSQGSPRGMISFLQNFIKPIWKFWPVDLEVLSASF